MRAARALSLLFFLACSPAELGGSLAATAGADASTADARQPSDAGVDAGPVPDAGRPDAGSPDAGQIADAGAAPDSGSTADAGTTPDAGHAVDAGPAPDAGAPDSGAAADAGAAPDAGSPDAGQVADAGSAPDAGQPADAGAAVDAGQAADAGVDYRAEMRRFVIDMADWTEARRAGFWMLPQNALSLFTEDGEASGAAATEYLSKIDGVSCESILYGNDGDGVRTSDEDRAWGIPLLQVAQNHGVQIILASYVDTQAPMSAAGQAKADTAQAEAAALGFINFSAPRRNLDVIPSYPSPLPDESSADITQLSEAKNALYLLNPGSFANKASLLSALEATNYDVLMIDAYWDSTVEYTAAEVEAMHVKANGGRRLVIAYLSVGEAEDYRGYWQASWSSHPPAWLAAENPNWAGNYKVRYWMDAWKALVYGSDGTPMAYVVDAGFDGAYLDIIDAYEYFEAQE